MSDDYDDYDLLGDNDGEDFDLLGDVEILGDDDDGDDLAGDVEILGDALDELLEGKGGRKSSAWRRRMARARRAAKKARAGASRPRVAASSPELGVTLAGIPITSIAAGATQSVNVPVAEPFRADRLILDQVGLRVDDIKIGTISQNVSGAPMPESAFASTTINSKLRGNTAAPGVGIDVTVTNPTAGAVELHGVFIGPSIIARRPRR